MRWVSMRVIAAFSLVVVVACERPPVVPQNDGGLVIDGRFGPIEFDSFVQDRPAVGGDWYLYDEDGGHLLTPFDQAYVIRDRSGQERFAALRVLSYYDPNTAESGTFTIAFTTWNGTSWASETEWQTPKDIKADGPLCVDLFGQTEVNCAGTQWQVQFRAYAFMAREGPLLVNRPGLFFRSAEGIDAGDVRVATLNTAQNLQTLSNPANIADLVDGEASGWDSIAWDYSRFAVDLPQAGMTLGSRLFQDGFVADDDIYFMLTGSRDVVKLQVAPVTEFQPGEGVVVTWTKLALDLSDNTIDESFPASTTHELDAPAEGDTRYFTFRTEDLRLETSVLEGTLSPHLPPRENRWDFALRRNDDGNLRVILSPGCALFNTTQQTGAVDFDAVMPPR